MSAHNLNRTMAYFSELKVLPDTTLNQYIFNNIDVIKTGFLSGMIHAFWVIAKNV